MGQHRGGETRLPQDAVDFLAHSPLALATGERIATALNEVGVPWHARTTTSQIAFRCRRGFAYLWLPGRYVRNPRTDVVLSIAMPHRVESDRWAEVAHPAEHVWMHHFDIRAVTDVDDQVIEWLAEAARAAV